MRQSWKPRGWRRLASGARSRPCWRRLAKCRPMSASNKGRLSMALRTGLPMPLRHDGRLRGRQRHVDIGRIHPISQVMDEVTAIFADMGFAVAEGPDVETDDYNFTKLNFPVGHPAREMHDTFFFNQKADGSRLLLRTHTSPVQVRTMLAEKPPIRVICPGRTSRRDSDQT